MILPYRVEANLIPLPVVRKVSQGYWPVNPEEPEIENVIFRKVDWSKVGAIAVEGLTSLGTMLMRNCADKNLKTGEEGTSKFTLPIRVWDNDKQESTIVNEMFAQNSKGHFGFVQNQLYSLVTNFQSLPVHYVLFTGHEKKYAEDGDLQCGINVPGKAITPLVPAWLGDCIHAQDYKVERVHTTADPNKPGEKISETTIEIVCRYYFTKHVDQATGAIFDAKPRVTHSKARELAKVFPGGFFVPDEHHGFDTYLRAVDKLAQDAAQADSLKDWRQKADEKLGRVPRKEPTVASQGNAAGPSTAPSDLKVAGR